MSVTRVFYGTTPDGKQVEQFTLRNAAGAEVRCLNYGCVITHFLLPCAEGPKDIVLGFEKLDDYLQDATFQGLVAGRYAGRIKGAAFALGGQEYRLLANEKGNFLHGSLSHAVYDAEPAGENAVAFRLVSPDGEDGFPGEINLCVLYTLTESSELTLRFTATTTADTHLNLANHSYFNLSGVPGSDILRQELQLFTDAFLEMDESSCPTGQLLPVAGTPMDFTTAKPIGIDINEAYTQLQLAGGYDHCFRLQKAEEGALAPAATARDPGSGISLRVYTTQPAVVLYTGNYLEGQPGKGGPLVRRGGFCLETQRYPSAPTFPAFPTTLLRAGETYDETTIFVPEWE